MRFGLIFLFFLPLFFPATTRDVQWFQPDHEW